MEEIKVIVKDNGTNVSFNINDATIGKVWQDEEVKRIWWYITKCNNARYERDKETAIDIVKCELIREIGRWNIPIDFE